MITKNKNNRNNGMTRDKHPQLQVKAATHCWICFLPMRLVIKGKKPAYRRFLKSLEVYELPGYHVTNPVMSYAYEPLQLLEK